MRSKRTEHRIRLEALFIVAGMIVEFVSLWWVGPSSFILFLSAGVVLSSIGVGMYVTSFLLRIRRHRSNR